MPLFHRQAPRKEMITAQFPNPKTGSLTSNNVSISHYPDTLSLSETAPPLHSKTPSTNSFTSKNTLERCNSSEYFLEIKKSAPLREPVSRKSAWGRTIRTEKSGGEVFESDAFAVDMPTTREPVFKVPREASVFRAKIPAPSRAQVEAYQTYKEKARQVRARNNSEGVRVPEEIVSYDCAYAREVGGKVGELRVEPAGAWPRSLGVGQRAWEMGGAGQAMRNRTSEKGVDKGAKSISEAAKVPIARKPVGLENSTRSRYRRDDSVTGASISSSSPSSSPKIKVRLVPRATPLQSQRNTPPKQRTLLSTPSPPSSSNTSRSSSPGKPNPHFAYTTSASEQLKDIHNTVFTHTTTSKTPPTTPKRTFATLLRERESRKKEQNRTLANRFAWLRPSGPRIAKPIPSTSPPTALPAVSTPTKLPPSSHTYIDPFSSTKLPRPPPVVSPTRKFETGFAQITRVCAVVVKLVLLLYALVAVYFILDAVREAVYVVGAPFRVGKMVGGWVGRGVMGVCRGGVRVVVRGGWGRWRV